jgi:hypothetical protein
MLLSILSDVMRTVDPTLPRYGTDFIATGALVLAARRILKNLKYDPSKSANI